MKTTADLVADLEAQGADLEVLATFAVRIALHRGYVTSGLARGTCLVAAKHLGLITRNRRKGSPSYSITPAGRAFAKELGLNE